MQKLFLTIALVTATTLSFASEKSDRVTEKVTEVFESQVYQQDVEKKLTEESLEIANTAISQTCLSGTICDHAVAFCENSAGEAFDTYLELIELLCW